MRALFVKEVRPFVAPGVVGLLLFAGLWIVVFDVESAFLAPPSRLMLATLFLGVHVGALLGWSQIQGERDATLSYLVHRAVTPARVLVAKCAAAYALLALVVLAPAALCALVERATSPLGPVLQWGRVGEIALAALVVVPAHALGMFVASLRASIVARLVFGAFALGGLGAAIGWALEHPVGTLATSRAAFALGCALVAAGLIAASAPGLARLEDADERPSLRSVGALLASLALFVVVPGHYVVSLAQTAVAQASVRAALIREAVRDPRSASGSLPVLAWHPELGAGLAIERDNVSTIRDGEGRVLDEIHWHRRGGGGDPMRGWSLLWNPGRPAPLRPQDVGEPRPYGYLDPGERDRSFRAPALTPAWAEETRFDTLDPPATATLYLDRSAGRFLALVVKGVAFEPEGPSWDGREPHATLREIVRPDGKQLSSAAQVERGDHDDLVIHDPGDGTGWRLERPTKDAGALDELALAPAAEVVAKRWTWSADGLRIGHYVPVWRQAESDATATDTLVRPEVEGDPLASTARIVDARTGEVLLTHDYAIAGWPARGARAFLCASELLRAPLLVAAGHFLQHPLDAWSADPTLTGWATGARRRPWLALANVALAALLALRARRALARAHAEPRRRRVWTAAILLAGFPAWLAFLLAEPAAPAAARAATASRPLLLRSREATA